MGFIQLKLTKRMTVTMAARLYVKNKEINNETA